MTAAQEDIRDEETPHLNEDPGAATLYLWNKITVNQTLLQPLSAGALSLCWEPWGTRMLGKLTRQPLTAAHVQGPSLGVISGAALPLTPAADEKYETRLLSLE